MAIGAGRLKRIALRSAMDFPCVYELRHPLLHEVSRDAEALRRTGWLKIGSKRTIHGSIHSSKFLLFFPRALLQQPLLTGLVVWLIGVSV